MSLGSLKGWAGALLPIQDCPPPLLCPCQPSTTAEQDQPRYSGKLEWGTHRALGLSQTPATGSSLWESRERSSLACV